jgi:hypothetical protein
VIVKLPDAPAARSPIVQLTSPAAPGAGLVHARPGAESETNVVLGGVLKSTFTPLAALAAPSLYVNV